MRTVREIKSARGSRRGSNARGSGFSTVCGLALVHPFTGKTLCSKLLVHAPSRGLIKIAEGAWSASEREGSVMCKRSECREWVGGGT